MEICLHQNKKQKHETSRNVKKTNALFLKGLNNGEDNFKITSQLHRTKRVM